MTSVEDCFELQCNQVFVGMVTMQYQAQIDMVSKFNIHLNESQSSSVHIYLFFKLLSVTRSNL